MSLCKSGWDHPTVHTGEKYSFRLQINTEIKMIYAILQKLSTHYETVDRPVGENLRPGDPSLPKILEPSLVGWIPDIS